jgi:hypothetical protein
MGSEALSTALLLACIEYQKKMQRTKVQPRQERYSRISSLSVEEEEEEEEEDFFNHYKKEESLIERS